LKWNSTFTYTQNKERIVELVADKVMLPTVGSLVLRSIHFYDYEKVGIWQTADTALARSFGYKAGDIRVNDLNGTGRKTRWKN
jgi:hypothetical protein